MEAENTDRLTEFVEKHGDFIQQIVLLIWLSSGQKYEDLYDVVTGVKTWYEMKKHLENGEGFEALKVGLMGWLHTGFGMQGVIQQSVTSTNLVENLSKKLLRDDEVEELRNKAILNITTFIQQNPNAGEETLRNVVLQELAMLAWTLKGDEAKGAVQVVTGLQVILGAWNRITKQDDIDSLREATLQSIVEFIRSNPKASPDEIRTEISNQVALFTARLSAL
uniref:Uncharacterized protein n=1 Tax=Strigamia maritima TaxID=126957 RepID=T1JGS0_STRMM